jgi:alginate O-acetyltransferase complex protein AlgI
VTFKASDDKSLLFYWLYAVAFCLQVYFDFSGYSDMAIGIGKILGFEFMENFNFPFISKSISEFWRRWHISLGSWFRDYVYIPLGGNRVKKTRWIFNILVVWFLTGFWHGAAWNFIIWGLYFFVILIIEKLFLLKYLSRTRVLKYIYTLIIVIISFLIFNVNTTSEIFIGLKNMFFLSDIPLINNEITYQLRNYLVIFIISIIAATPLMSIVINKLKNTKLNNIINILEPIYYLLLLTLSTAFLIDASFNPFLYFRF